MDKVVAGAPTVFCCEKHVCCECGFDSGVVLIAIVIRITPLVAIRLHQQWSAANTLVEMNGRDDHRRWSLEFSKQYPPPPLSTSDEWQFEFSDDVAKL